MGNFAGGSGFSAEMRRVRPSDYDCPEAGGKEYKGPEERLSAGELKLTFQAFHGIIKYRDI